MKAKEYYEKLKSFTSEDEFFEAQNQMMYDLVSDVENLIKTRKATAKHAIIACILEVDKKYKAFCRIHESQRDSLPDDCFIKNIEFLDDGFKAIYVELHKEHSYAFDIESYKKKIEVREQVNESLKSFVPHKVTPFEELTMENLGREILDCLYSLSGLANLARAAGLPLSSCKPLAQRITLLRYWMDKKEINLEDVKEFEKDPDKWCNNHIY